MRRSQSGQVMVLVAVSLMALIGSAALVLVAGSAEWQKNQLQQLADQAALDSAMKITIGCDAGKAGAVITEADNFLAIQRTRTGALSAPAGSCAAQYTSSDTFAGSLSATINYPYRAHQQQVEVVLSLTLPLSFGGAVGKTTTTVVRRAVAQALPGSTSAVSATTLTCGAGQVNVSGSVLAQNLIVR
ncbi:MAG TPA: pilus assembly protein TadG-related protein, partial [Candidatus Dormibacteraeota bacterium]|nr:pilus assembly protein TadG-related protein [Candidatus Dormibacteraeota bacterium]